MFDWVLNARLQVMTKNKVKRKFSKILLKKFVWNLNSGSVA